MSAAGVMAYTYYRHDGFIVRHPAPRTVENLRVLEKRAPGGWEPAPPEMLEDVWYGMELTSDEIRALGEEQDDPPRSNDEVQVPSEVRAEFEAALDAEVNAWAKSVEDCFRASGEERVLSQHGDCSPILPRVSDDGRIKIHATLHAKDAGVSGEYLWATPVGVEPDGTRRAVIDNIPWFSDLNLDDTVIVDGQGEILRIAARSPLGHAVVSLKEGTTDDQIDALAAELHAHGARMERATAEFLALTIAPGTLDQVRDILFREQDQIGGIIDTFDIDREPEAPHV